MQNKKIFFTAAALLVFLLAPVHIFSIEWDAGGTFFNSTGFVSDETTSDTELEQLNTLSLRFEAYNESESGTNGLFTAQGRYEYTDERAYLFDVDILKLSGTFPGAAGNNSVLEASGGRMFFSDPTGMVLSHNADGASFKLLYPGIRLLFAGGYTGLLLNPSSDIRMTSIDLSEEDIEMEDNFFGPKKMFMQSTVTFPEIWWLNSMSLFGMAVFDLRDESEGAVMNTQYLGVQTERSYGKNLYQDLFLILQSAKLTVPDIEDRNALGLLFGLRLRYLKEDFYASRFQFRLIGAPPDVSIDDFVDVPFGVLGFVPLNQPVLGESVSPSLTGLGLAELTYSFRPFYGNDSETAAALQPFVGLRGYFRTYSVSVDWIDTDPDSDSYFIGTELEAGTLWRIFSDLGMEFKGAYFLPSTGIGAASSDMESIFAFHVNLSISF